MEAEELPMAKRRREPDGVLDSADEKSWNQEAAAQRLEYENERGRRYMAAQSRGCDVDDAENPGENFETTTTLIIGVQVDGTSA